jgi:hypothetical protein
LGLCICIDQNNILYVVDDLIDNIRKIDITTGIVSTFVGSTTGASGDVDGIGTQALISDPTNLCFVGNDIYFVCMASSKIKKISNVLANYSFVTIQNVLYPNPTKGTFTIEVPNTTINKISIYDMVGKMVFTENLDDSFSYTYKNEALNKGMYIVFVVTEKGSFNKMFVVH